MRNDRTVRQWVGLGIVIVVIALLWSRSARADDEDTNQPELRTLAGFQFVPSALVAWGFIENSFATNTSASLVRFTPGTGTVIARVIQLPELRAIGIAQTTSASIALAPWLGISGNITGAGVIPRNAASALTIGGSEDLEAGGGVALRLIRTEAFQLTARGDAGWTDTRTVQPTNLPDPVLVLGSITTVQPSLVAMLALTREIAIQASGSYTWRSFDQATTEQVQTAGGAIAASLSMYPVLPLTFQLGAGAIHRWGAQVDTIPELAIFGSSTTPVTGEGGIFYTGRRDLDLGATATYEFNSDHRATAYIRFGYYF